MNAAFFTDRDLGRHKFPSALRSAGVTVHPHHLHFRDEEDDLDWIREVAARGWYAISNDTRIYRNKVQREAVMSAGLGLFLLPGGDRPIVLLAQNFVECVDLVQRFIERHERPFIASVTRPGSPRARGRVELRYPRP